MVEYSGGTVSPNFEQPAVYGVIVLVAAAVGVGMSWLYDELYEHSVKECIVGSEVDPSNNSPEKPTEAPAVVEDPMVLVLALVLHGEFVSFDSDGMLNGLASQLGISLSRLSLAHKCKH